MVWNTRCAEHSTRLRPFFLCALMIGTGFAPWWANAEQRAPSGLAGSHSSVTEDLYFGELPVVLSATRLTQPITEAPVAVTLIDRQMIEASGARELADIFRLVPGFVVGSINGHQRIVGYHGLLDAFNRRMQVLVDGRSVYTSTYGGVRWTDLPLAIEDIERIEVVRGPNAATYGPNSFLGVISIHTRHATEDTGSAFKQSVGSDGIADTYYRHGGGSGDFDYRVTLRASADSGFNSLHDDKLVRVFTFRGDYQLTPNDSLEFHTGLNSGPREVATIVDRKQNAESYFVQGLWRHQMEPGNEVRLQLYHNSDSTQDSYYAEALPLFGTVDLSRTGERTNIELQHVFSPSDPFNIVWGVEIRHDSANSATLFGTRENVTNDLARLFGSFDWQLTENTNASLGAMIEDNDITNRSTSPRFAINHQLTPGHVLRASVSRATRTPSLFESHANFGFIVNNAAGPPPQVALVEYIAPSVISAEKVESLELGYLFNLPRIGLSGDVRLFRENIEDLFAGTNIAPADIPATYNGVPIYAPASSLDTGTNDDQVTLRGVEIQTEFRPNGNNRVLFGASFLDIDSSNILENYQLSVPKKTASLMWIHEMPNSWSTGLSFYYVDELSYLDTSGNDIVGEQRRVDLRIANEFKMYGYPAQIAMVFQNMFDSYEDYTHSNMFDKRAYASLSVHY